MCRHVYGLSWYHMSHSDCSILLINMNFPRPPLNKSLCHSFLVAYLVTCVRIKHQLPLITIIVFVIFVLYLCFYCLCFLFASCLFTNVYEQKLNFFPVLKLSIPCISDQCIRLLHEPNAQYQIHINSKDNAATCFGKNIPSSGSTLCQY